MAWCALAPRTSVGSIIQCRFYLQQSCSCRIIKVIHSTVHLHILLSPPCTFPIIPSSLRQPLDIEPRHVEGGRKGLDVRAAWRARRCPPAP